PLDELSHPVEVAFPGRMVERSRGRPARELECLLESLAGMHGLTVRNDEALEREVEHRAQVGSGRGRYAALPRSGGFRLARSTYRRTPASAARVGRAASRSSPEGP